jgi:hypothetical protein
MYDDRSQDRPTQPTDDFYEADQEVPETYNEAETHDAPVDYDETEVYDAPRHSIPSDEGSQSDELVAQLHSGANWFYWIAALSVVNSVIIACGANWNFVVGLGITQIIDFVAAGVAQDLNPTAAMILTGIALAISVTIAGMFAGMGYLAKRAHTWVFIIGMLVYACDGLLFVLFQEWLSVGFHAFALFGLFAGFKASQQLKTYAVDQQFQLAPEAS